MDPLDALEDLSSDNVQKAGTNEMSDEHKAIIALDPNIVVLQNEVYVAVRTIRNSCVGCHAAGDPCQSDDTLCRAGAYAVLKRYGLEK